MGLPRAVRLVFRGQMRPAVFGFIVLTPGIWLVLLFAVGFFFPALTEYIAKTPAFNLGACLGTLAIILSPLSKKSRSDFAQDFDKAYERFYKSHTPQQKEAHAAIRVASNLYLHTIPGGEDAPVPLRFSLPDSRYRYLIFCLSATTTACAPEMKNPDAVVSECLRGLASQSLQEFIGGSVNVQEAAKNGAAYLQEFLNGWSRCVQLEKEGNNGEIIDLICSMIHTTESNVPYGKTDAQRLGELALWIHCRLPSLRSAFVGLAKG